MKTPDEIKKGLALGGHSPAPPNTEMLMCDALAYIKQLEKTVAEAIKQISINGDLCGICKHNRKTSWQDAECAKSDYVCAKCAADCHCKDCRWENNCKGFEVMQP